MKKGTIFPEKAPTLAPTHARRGLPVNPNPNPVPVVLYISATHYTVTLGNYIGPKKHQKFIGNGQIIGFVKIDSFM